MLEKGGVSKGVPSVETALQYPYTSYDRYRIQDNRKRMIVGTPEQVKETILRMSEEYNTTEFMIVTSTHEFEDKRKSYQLLAETFGV